MKIETRNQLIGVIVGTAVALGIPLLPGLSGQARMLVVLVCILVIFRIFKSPSVIKLFTKKIKGDNPGAGPSGPNRR